MVLQLIRVLDFVSQTDNRHEFAIIDVLKFGLTDLLVAAWINPRVPLADGYSLKRGYSATSAPSPKVKSRRKLSDSWESYLDDIRREKMKKSFHSSRRGCSRI